VRSHTKKKCFSFINERILDFGEFFIKTWNNSVDFVNFESVLVDFAGVSLEVALHRIS